MSKKLNLIEAMKMPIGTKFKVILNAEEHRYFAKIIELQVEDKKQLVWDDGANTQIILTDAISCAIFTPIPKLVNFMEVVESQKRCKVEHKLINDAYLDEYKKKDLEKFASLDWVLFNITNNNIDVNEIILNGKWYIEESVVEE